MYISFSKLFIMHSCLYKYKPDINKEHIYYKLQNCRSREEVNYNLLQKLYGRSEAAAIKFLLFSGKRKKNRGTEHTRSIVHYEKKFPSTYATDKPQVVCCGPQLKLSLVLGHSVSSVTWYSFIY